jgi:hypothetical protein
MKYAGYLLAGMLALTGCRDNTIKVASSRPMANGFWTGELLTNGAPYAWDLTRYHGSNSVRLAEGQVTDGNLVSLQPTPVRLHNGELLGNVGPHTPQVVDLSEPWGSVVSASKPADDPAGHLRYSVNGKPTYYSRIPAAILKEKLRGQSGTNVWTVVEVELPVSLFHLNSVLSLAAEASEGGIAVLEKGTFVRNPTSGAIEPTSGAYRRKPAESSP